MSAETSTSTENKIVLRDSSTIHSFNQLNCGSCLTSSTENMIVLGDSRAAPSNNVVSSNCFSSITGVIVQPICKWSPSQNLTGYCITCGNYNAHWKRYQDLHRMHKEMQFLRNEYLLKYLRKCCVPVSQLCVIIFEYTKDEEEEGR
jgi:hypothetical protein